MINFDWDEPHLDLRNRIIAFAQTELNPGLTDRDEQHCFDLRGWRQCGKQGILGLPVPQRYGGGGHDALTTAYALEGFGYGSRDNGLNFAIGAHLFGCTLPIMLFGRDGQQATYLPRLCDGTAIGALAVSEAEAGSDAFSLRTTAVRQGDHYLLNGHKLFVTNGAVADLIVVLATLDPTLGNHGLTAFLIERGMAGVKSTPPVRKMGLHTAAMGEIILENCAVPAANLLGAEGSGMALFSHAMLWERGLILAVAVGAMQRQLETCVTYAQSRRQFGQPIGQFQSVAGRLVDMRQRLEQARLLLYKMAWLLHKEELAFDMAALTKLTISEAWIANCHDALAIHGGYGYLTATGIERDLRDALGSRFYSGTPEIQRQVVAQWMGVGG
jgi:alkylation response protein AidB-like acyl-CoA dehydrogenase